MIRLLFGLFVITGPSQSLGSGVGTCLIEFKVSSFESGSIKGEIHNISEYSGNGHCDRLKTGLTTYFASRRFRGNSNYITLRLPKGKAIKPGDDLFLMGKYRSIEQQLKNDNEGRHFYSYFKHRNDEAPGECRHFKKHSLIVSKSIDDLLTITVVPATKNRQHDCSRLKRREGRAILNAPTEYVGVHKHALVLHGYFDGGSMSALLQVIDLQTMKSRLEISLPGSPKIKIVDGKIKFRRSDGSGSIYDLNQFKFMKSK